MGPFFLTFLYLLVIGLPVAVGLGLACVMFLWWTGNMDILAAFPQRMVAGIDQFVLLTIPLFILSGSLMNAGGLTDQMVRFSRALVGHIHGGMAQVNVVSNMLFSGVSGSATAEASALGSVLIPAMVREGYPPAFAAAFTGVTSVLGPIIPPSIGMIVYGVLTGTSIAKLFLSGVVPGVLIGGSLMVYAYFQAKRHGYAVSARQTWSERLTATWQAAPALVLPVIILGGILTGVFTPTESAAVAVLYALVLAGLYYRTLSLKMLYSALVDTAVVTSGIMIIVGVASMVAFAITFEQVPAKVAQAMLSLTQDKTLLLLIINAALLLLGFFLEPISIMILTLPVLVPLLKMLEVDLVHFGMVMTFNTCLGLVHPPLGICLYIVSGISGVKVERISVAAMPMIGICLVLLLVITYVPWLSLWLPGLFDTATQ
jgi:C4-dicarboxylate transporter DctM subunit